MAELTSSFGVALRQLRTRRGWSQEALALYADLNRSYVGDLERNLSTPSLVTLEKLAAALDCSPSTLLEHVEDIASLRELRELRGLHLSGIAG
jgi:XRE family transcriptional regulator, regulator of sulfur utilization